MEFGLGMFYTLEELERLFNSDTVATAETLSFRTASVTFSEPYYLAFDDLDAIEANEWPIANDNAYPLVYQVLPKTGPIIQPVTLDHIDIFEACFLALPPVIRKHRADLRKNKMFEEEITVETFRDKCQLHIALQPLNF